VKVGGIFCLETPGVSPGEREGGEAADQEKVSLRGLFGGEDMRFCMSGRCAIYYCLLDLIRSDTKRTAYLPAYTCETVIAPYKKAGYTLKFYDVDPRGLVPRFDRGLIGKISVLSLCGYYGFSNYDRDFVDECVRTETAVIQDITHSAFSSGGIEERAAYTAGSLRKWLGIASGGIAVKRRGRFVPGLLPPEEEHLRGRFACFEERKRVVNHEEGASDEKAGEIFWTTELRLREIFDAYAGDSLSEEILERFPYGDMIRKRRENYAAVLAADPFGAEVKPVFPVLDEGVCPSHMSLYSPDRNAAQEFLDGQGIGSTFYWPFHGEVCLNDFPGTRYICDHIYSVPVDQRYTAKDMALVCEALRKLGNSNSP
jgi:hypothetical protein